MKPKIIVAGELYSQNLGDGLLSGLLTECLKEDFDILPLDLSMAEPYPGGTAFLTENFKKMSAVKGRRRCLVSVLRIKAGIRSRISLSDEKYIRHAGKSLEEEGVRALVFAGGQLFHSYFLPLLRQMTDLASARGIPVFFHAVGCGLPFDRQDMEDLSHILFHPAVRRITVRDGEKTIFMYWPHAQVIKTFDTALLARRFYQTKTAVKPLGINVMLTKKMSYDGQKRYWIRLLTFFERKEADFELYTNGSFEDQQFALHILLSMKKQPALFLHPRPLNPSAFVEMTARYERILAMRFHSVLLAAALKIPAAALEWDAKTGEFYTALGAPGLLLPFGEKPAVVFKRLMTADLPSGLHEAEETAGRAVGRLREDLLNLP
jgi:polysaccharide pyruvyl transferase WcaK-like protein